MSSCGGSTKSKDTSAEVIPITSHVTSLFLSLCSPYLFFLVFSPFSLFCPDCKVKCHAECCPQQKDCLDPEYALEGTESLLKPERKASPNISSERVSLHVCTHVFVCDCVYRGGNMWWLGESADRSHWPGCWYSWNNIWTILRHIWPAWSVRLYILYRNFMFWFFFWILGKWVVFFVIVFDLSSGQFGVVQSCVCKADSTTWAVKIVNKRRFLLRQKVLESLQREMAVLKKCHHVCLSHNDMLS